MFGKKKKESIKIEIDKEEFKNILKELDLKPLLGNVDEEVDLFFNDINIKSVEKLIVESIWEQHIEYLESLLPGVLKNIIGGVCDDDRQ